MFYLFVESKNIPEDFNPQQLCPPAWLTVKPQTVNVNPGETVEFVVQYFPGITGEFTQYFYINVSTSMLTVLIDLHFFGL